MHVLKGENTDEVMQRRNGEFKISDPNQFSQMRHFGRGSDYFRLLDFGLGQMAEGDAEPQDPACGVVALGVPR